MQVHSVSNRRDHCDFCLFPYTLYATDVNWVAPLLSEEKKRWNTRTNAALSDVWHRRFIAKRGSRVVGRIAAIDNEDYSRRWFENGGVFGFFESEDNDETAAALLAAAENALQHRGRSRMVGPINLTTHDETGILLSGFDVSHAMLTPHNPSYYEQLLKRNGYFRHSDYLAYAWSPHCSSSPPLNRLRRRLIHSMKQSLRIRSFKDDKWQSNIQIVHDLYNRSFDRTPGFVHIGWDDFQDRANQFRPFYRPELCLVAELHDQAVGFAIVLPDINQAIAKTNGRLWPLGWLKIARALPKIRKLRFILLGVVPEIAGRGISVALIDEALRVARQLGIESAELSLVHRQNERVQHVIEAFGAKQSKLFRLFQKDLTP